MDQIICHQLMCRIDSMQACSTMSLVLLATSGQSNVQAAGKLALKPTESQPIVLSGITDNGF